MAENRLPDNQKPGAATSEIQEGDQRMKDGDSVDDKIVSGQHPTPMLDQLEDGPWPSFVTGLKRLRDSKGEQYAPMMNDLLGQLNHSYE